MTLWFVPGRGYMDDSQEGVSIPFYGSMGDSTWGVKDIREVPTYENAWQYESDTGSRYQWEPGMAGTGEAPAGMNIAPGYINQLLQWADAAEAGQLKPYEQEQWEQLKAQATAVPLRDVGQLYGGWTVQQDDPTAQRLLNVNSPDIGNFMLTVRDKIKAGTASPQERGLFDETARMAGDWAYRANVPQASDAFSIFGDNLLSALAVLGTGLSGGMAAAPLAAGGTSLATTLGSLGTLAGTAGGWAGTIGGATGQDWLAKLGMGLGLAGGLAGGLGGLTNVLSTGVQSVGDAARLAQSAGKITGALGRIPGADPLKQASQVLGLAGSLGQAGSGAAGLLGAAQGLSQGATQALPDTGGRMAWDDFGSTDWLDWRGGGQGPLLSDAAPGIDWSSFTAGGPGSWAGQVMTDWADGGGGGGGGGFLSTLGGLASGALGALAKPGVLGPLLSGAGALGAGALGSNASSDAARLQAAALNRALSLQEAQWLASQANQAPWMEAGRTALGQLQGLAGQGQPSLQQPGLPGTQPFQYSGPGMPGQGFQYTGAGMPQTGFQYTGPGMPETGFQYINQMPTQDFQAPTFEALKARDPGIQARLDEARNALEASALARGSGMSGATLSALQRQSQDLTSREYAPAYQRVLGEYQQTYGQDWQRQQEAYQRALAQNQQLYGRQYQQQGDIYGRQLAENQLGYNRQWQQQDTDYQRQLAQNQLLYGRGMEQYRQGYGEQAALNQQDYTRNQALYNQQYQQMTDAYNAQRLAQTTDWNRYAALAGLGQTSLGQLTTAGQNNVNQQTGLLGQLGTAQAGGATNQANAWMNALQNVGGAAQGYFGNQAYMQGLQSILSGLNR